ncbi:MAG: BREX-1 system adenine-specific DNA-methyltransferase PglX, partial [Desulfobacterium sp.]|nr:BREX-1 system adenine-specific DNA-methyltransferase PglX [Desulfobacterium sp.]
MMGLREATKGQFKRCVTNIRNRLLEDMEQACYQRYSLNAKDRSKVQLSCGERQCHDRLLTWLNDPIRPHKEWELNLKVLIKERAYTLTNRLVILMQLESRGLRTVKLISQGIERSTFRQEQEFFVALVQGDDQGFAFILQQVWDQLALALPALFSYSEVHECVPLPGPTLLWLIQELNQEGLNDAWIDDTTLGWLYQYWNDPDRKAVDAKLNTTSGKVEAHELAQKTQLFTERYMVEWLVQNSLGAQWLAMCEKHGWNCRAKEKIEILKIRRKAWNQDITDKKVPETQAMPVNGHEEFWKYYVPQELDQGTIQSAPLSLDRVKILDPAMGSGHFLVYVFDFLWELYQDQARLQEKEYSTEQILGWILNNNLHGIDIDNRAVQIGAAALYIKTQEKYQGYKIDKLNLVASDLGIGHLEADDPAILKFVEILEQELGLVQEVSLQIINALKGAEYLGSLLQVDKEIERIVKESAPFAKTDDVKVVQEKIFQALTGFIQDHDQGEDLGLKTLAEQMGKGLRLIELLGQKYDVVTGNPPYLSKGKVVPALDNLFDDGSNELYEVLVGRAKTWLKEQGYLSFLTTHNFMFLDKFKDFRSFIKREGIIHSLAQLGVWTFRDVSQPGALGITLFIWQKSKNKKDIAIYQRIGSGQHRTDPKFKEKIPLLINQNHSYTFPQSRFAEIPGAPMIYWWPEEFRQAYLNSPKLGDIGIVRQGMATSSNNRFLRKPFEIMVDNIGFHNDNSKEITFRLTWYPYVKGAAGKRWFEGLTECVNYKHNGLEVKSYASYLYASATRTVKNQNLYFKQGLAFSYIGTNGFLCRLRKYKSIFDVSGSSIFCEDPEKMQVILSSNLSGYVSQSLNPTVNNQVGDIENLPVLDQLSDYTVYLKRAENLYDKLFASTESNLEYTYQHLSAEKFEVEEARIRDEIDKELLQQFSWKTIQAIYQEIGESPFDFPLWDGKLESIPKDFKESYQAEDSLLKLSQKYRLHPDSLIKIKDELGLVHEGRRKDKAFKHLSWAMGVMLGRFDAQTGGLTDLADQRRKEQHLAPDPKAPQAHGLLYLSALDDREGLNRGELPNMGNACLKTLEEIFQYKWGREKTTELWMEIENALVLDCRKDWTPAQRAKKELNTWIRNKAFAMHLSIYQNRPIYFPLVSAKKNFFFWVNIHQWTDGTLNNILANYLNPDKVLLEGRIKRLREERPGIKETRQLNAM